jgi:hypothetical protein
MMADHEESCLCSAASITSRMNSSSQITLDMFSTIPVDSNQAVLRSCTLCKILSVVSRGRGDCEIDCTRYGLLLSVFMIEDLQGLFFRYCIPLDNNQPERDLRYFDDICPDKNGTSKHTS